MSGVGAIALSAYRLSHGLHVRGLRAPARWVSTAATVVTGIHLDPAAVIEPPLIVAHCHGLVVEAGVRVGPACMLHQGVTLGEREGGVPTLGAGVFVYSGAVILGDVHVGEHARIGANAVVLEDVAAGEVVVGVPARAVSRTPSVGSPGSGEALSG